MAGGKERAVSKIANVLCHFYPIGVVSIANTRGSFYGLASAIECHSLDALSFLGQPKGPRTFFLFCKAIRSLAGFVKHERPAIIIGTDFLINLMLLIARVIAGLPTRIVGWEHLPLEEPIISRRRYLKTFRNLFYRKLDNLIVLTSTDLAFCFQHHIKALVIPNPRSFDFEGMINYQQKNVLTIARLSYQKGLDLYLKVIAALKAELDGWQFILVAKEDDIELSTFRSQIAEYQLEDIIQIHPPNEAILPYYTNASIYLLTSRYEGLPITLIEAQTCGLPCVSFDCKTGPAEIISHGNDGYLVPPFSIEEMGKHLLSLMQNPDLRARFGQAAKIASKRFDERHVIKLWQNFVENTK